MQKTLKSTANGKRIDKELVLLSANFLLLGERFSGKLIVKSLTHSTLGSVSLRPGLLMVSPLRGWEPTSQLG